MALCVSSMVNYLRRFIIKKIRFSRMDLSIRLALWLPGVNGSDEREVCMMCECRWASVLRFRVGLYE